MQAVWQQTGVLGFAVSFTGVRNALAVELNEGSFIINRQANDL